jgi:hypothetical protein
MLEKPGTAASRTGADSRARFDRRVKGDSMAAAGCILGSLNETGNR